MEIPVYDRGCSGQLLDASCSALIPSGDFTQVCVECDPGVPSSHVADHTITGSGNAIDGLVVGCASQTALVRIEFQTPTTDLTIGALTLADGWMTAFGSSTSTQLAFPGQFEIVHSDAIFNTEAASLDFDTLVFDAGSVVAGSGFERQWTRSVSIHCLDIQQH